MKKYILMVNVDKEKKQQIIENLENEGFNIILNEENYIYAKNKELDNIMLDKEKEFIDLVIQIANMYKNCGELYLDLSKEVDSIIDKNYSPLAKEGIVRWMIRQAITRAIGNKQKS